MTPCPLLGRLGCTRLRGGSVALGRPRAIQLVSLLATQVRCFVVTFALALLVCLCGLLLQAAVPRRGPFTTGRGPACHPFCLCWVLALGQSAGPASGPLAWRSCQHSRRLPRPVSEQTSCLQWCCTWGLAFLRLPEPCPPSPACLAVIPGSALIPRTCKGYDGPGLTAPAAEREARLQETIGPPAAPRPPYQGRPPVYEVPRPENAAEHAGPAFIHGHFCVLCPSVQGEVVTIALRAPCECDFALSEINEARFPERRDLYPRLLPAAPQPPEGVGIVLGMPLWADTRHVACFDARGFGNRLWAVVVPERIRSNVEIYVGSSWVPLRPGERLTRAGRPDYLHAGNCLVSTGAVPPAYAPECG